jgi:hypothetical protein
VFQIAVAVAAVVMLVLGGAASSYGPTPIATWVVSGGSTGGTVEAVAVSGSKAYVGGDFAYMGPETGSFVSLDSTSGAVTTPWPVVGGTVNAVASERWLVHRRLVRLDRHQARGQHRASNRRHARHRLRGTDGPAYTLAATSTARSCSRAASSRRHDAPAARRARRSRPSTERRAR